MGEAPGETEVKLGVPFVGVSGQELDRMLQEAGILRSECFITNVCRVRPLDNKIEHFFPSKKKDVKPHFILFQGHYVDPVIKEGYQLLLDEIAQVEPNVIVALGNLSLWALTGNEGITSWRGSLLTTRILDREIKVIPVLHPAFIMRQWTARGYTVHDLKRVKKESLSPSRAFTNYKFTVRPTFALVMKFLHDLRLMVEAAPLPVSVDIETRARKHISCIGLAVSSYEAICIPLMCVERPEGYWSLEEELEIILALRYITTHPNFQGIGQNFSYDQQYFAKEFGFVPNLWHDTMNVQHTLYPGTPKDLSHLSSLFCDDHVYWKDDGKEWNLNTGEDKQWVYNCTDGVRTYEIAMAQQQLLDQANLRHIHDFRMELQRHVLVMMLDGVRFNREATPFLGKQLEALLQNRLNRLEYICDHPLNPSSPQQLQKFFYVDLKEPVVFDKKSRKPTLGDDAMQKIIERNPILRPIANLILDYRSFRVFKSTFVEAPPSADGRMRCSFNVSGPYTFRMASSEDAFGLGANLQNIPSEETKSLEKARKRGSAQDYPDIRKLYLADLPDDGGEWIFWNADLDRADLQVVVWEADDEELMQLLREGADLHVENAKVLFGLQMASEVTKGMRGFAKAFVHGTNYGGTPRTMAAAAGVTVRQAEIAQARWFQAHPGIKAWQERVMHELQTKRMIKNILGYRWVVFDRPDNAYTEALAWGPQSTVGCVINKGLVNLATSVPRSKCRTLIQVHDSLAGVCRPDFDLTRIKQNLEITLPYAKPLTIPVSIETSPVSWGDCH